MKKVIGILATVTTVSLMLYVAIQPSDAALREGFKWTGFPSNVQLGDNSGNDTIDVSGVLEVDSTLVVGLSVDAQTNLLVNSAAAVWPLGFEALNDSISGAETQYVSPLFARAGRVSFVSLNLDEAVETANCTLWVKSTTDSTALVIVADTANDSLMACATDFAASDSIRAITAPVTNAKSGAATQALASDVTLWVEWR